MHILPLCKRIASHNCEPKYPAPPATRIVLFVKLKDQLTLNDDLIQSIKSKIRNNCSPRHVPSIIKSCPDIPRTKSGKIVEIAVRKILNNEKINNVEALANPEALEFFKKLKI